MTDRWLKKALAFGSLTFWLAPGGAAVADETAQKAVPPPVPFYSTHVSNTAILGAGIIVITTRDPFDAVLGWYRANLKDQMADVAVGPGHHHFMTGGDANAGTKISLLWNAGIGSPYQTPPPQEAAKTPTANPPAAAPAAVPNPPAPEAPEPELATVEPLHTDPLTVHPAGTEIAMANLPPPAPEAPAAPEPELAAVEPLHTDPLTVHPAGTEIAMANLPQPKAAPAEPPPPATEPAGLDYFRDGRYAEALLAWEKAAEAGSVEAPLFIGMMYDTGQGIPASATDALAWYRKAADKGNLTGLFNVGVMYDGGYGVRRDPAEAADWYTRAAAKGSGRAAFNLALLLQAGDGVAEDDQAATKYFQKAARLGVTSARSHLRHSASEADADLAFNTVHAIAGAPPGKGDRATTERLRHAADHGDAAAAYDLANRLENGIGADIDLREAYALYRLAGEGARSPLLKLVAEAGAAQVEAHLDHAAGKPAKPPQVIILPGTKP
jgi:TPR repeat protein